MNVIEVSAALTELLDYFSLGMHGMDQQTWSEQYPDEDIALTKIEKLHEFCREFEHLEAENARLRQMIEWQPIETMPKVQSPHVLATDGHRVGLAHWHQGLSEFQWIGISYEGLQVIYPPTRWMPLPPPEETL